MSSHQMLCRAALARSKGWAPRPLSQPKGAPAAEGSADVGSDASAMKVLPWRDPGLRFTSAPVIDDDYMTVRMGMLLVLALEDKQDMQVTF